MQNTTSTKFAIIGAGIGGLTAALALQRVGQKVAIFEQAQILGEVGAGLTISPNASHVFDYLGLREGLAERGTALGKGTVRHYATNDLLIETPSGTADEQIRKFGNIQYQIHRADLHALLLEAVLTNDPDCLHVGHQLTDIQQDGTSTTATFRNGKSCTASVAIACDGSKSVSRDKLFGNAPPSFAGYVAYRGLLPADALDPSLIETGATLSIGPGQMFMRYPVRNGDLVNAVGLVRSSEWKEDGWSIPAELDEVLEHFSAWHGSIKDILSAVPQDKRFKWAILHRAPLSSWISGRVALLGDAAHTITPFLGQGAAMAIEDAAILGRAVDAHDSLDKALAVYDRTRTVRGNWVFLESQQQAGRLMNQEPSDFDRQKTQEVYHEVYSYNPVSAPLAA